MHCKKHKKIDTYHQQPQHAVDLLQHMVIIAYLLAFISSPTPSCSTPMLPLWLIRNPSCRCHPFLYLCIETECLQVTWSIAIWSIGLCPWWKLLPYRQTQTLPLIILHIHHAYTWMWNTNCHHANTTLQLARRRRRACPIVRNISSLTWEKHSVCAWGGFVLLHQTIN